MNKIINEPFVSAAIIIELKYKVQNTNAFTVELI